MFSHALDLDANCLVAQSELAEATHSERDYDSAATYAASGVASITELTRRSGFALWNALLARLSYIVGVASLQRMATRAQAAAACVHPAFRTAPAWLGFARGRHS